MWWRRLTRPTRVWPHFFFYFVGVFFFSSFFANTHVSALHLCALLPAAGINAVASLRLAAVLSRLLWGSPGPLAALRNTGMDVTDEESLYTLVRDVLLRYCKTERRKKNTAPAKTAARILRNKMHTNRNRLAQRLLKGHREAVIQLELSNEDEARGCAVLTSTYMPEIRVSDNDAVFVHLELPWWSAAFRIVYERAKKYMPKYPGQKVIQVADTQSELFVQSPTGAPVWAVTMPDAADVAAVANGIPDQAARPGVEAEGGGDDE
jgi:hypothetical protein